MPVRFVVAGSYSESPGPWSSVLGPHFSVPLPLAPRLGALEHLVHRDAEAGKEAGLGHVSGTNAHDQDVGRSFGMMSSRSLAMKATSGWTVR